MTKRIILYVLVALLIIAAFSVILTLQATTNVIGQRQEAQLRELVGIVYRGYIELGEKFTEDFENQNYNITIISPDGKIINDEFEEAWYLVTDQRALELFLSRVLNTPETICSTNTSFLFGSLILAGISAKDGSVIVASSTLRTFADTFFDMRIEIIYILLLAILTSALLARLISFLIVKPLNDINVESPTPEIGKKYREILPLLNKIQEQKGDIALQREQLKEGQNKFRAVSESLVEGLILTEGNDKISYINKSAIDILELSEDSLDEDYHLVFDSVILKIIDDTLQKGPQTTIIYRKTRTYQVDSTKLKNDDEIVGVSLLIYDITRRVEIEKQRRDFTANVSHELKTPLHIIAGSAELLESGLVKEEDKKGFIDQIYNETKRMSQLIEDIIRLSKLDEKGLTIDQEVINVRKAIVQIVDSLKNVAEERNINILITGKDIYIKSNPSMLTQILSNLIDNAIKYTNEGGKVEVRTKEENGKAIIEVEDNGIGIPDEYQDRIFERFFRVDKSRSKAVGGTGLGLAIVKHACIVNGGDIEVESKVGKGSIFRVTFDSVKESNNKDD